MSHNIPVLKRLIDFLLSAETGFGKSKIVYPESFACPGFLFLEHFQLLVDLWFFCFGFCPKQLHHTKLLVGDLQDTHLPAGR